MGSRQYLSSAPGLKYLPLVLIILVGVLEAGFFLGILTDFWFDDDATLFAFVSRVENPLSFFLSRKVIAASGFSFTPMQMFSYWCDFQIGGTSPKVAYVHQLFVFVLTAVTLFSVLRFSQSVIFSLLVTIAWMFLPATIAIQEFIGTRHYMEGFLLILSAIFFCYKNLSSETFSERFWFAGLALFLLFLAMLCKEIYVTSGCLFVFILLLFNKRYWEAASVIAIAMLYTSYRLWAIGLSSKYPMPTMDAAEYFEFLAKLPFVFSGNYLGYLLFMGAILYGVFLLVKREFPYLAGIVYILIIIISLATIYPGSQYLSNDWQSRGTWYRLPFLLNFIFLIGGGLLFQRGNHQFNRVMIVIVIITLIHGAYMTRNNWDTLKDRYAVTGRYYIENHDRIVFSEVPAYWYLGGLKSLYHLKQPFILSAYPKKFKYSDASDIREVWRYKDGAMVADAVLWEKLRQRFTQHK